MKVVIPYTPRTQQSYVHKSLDNFRYAVLCMHRRWGKTVMCINFLIKSAMTNKHHAPRYAYIAPTYSQAKKIAWDYLKFYTEKIPGTKYNETELRCDLLNGARISLLSSENPDSIRGIGLDAAVIDEAASCSQSLIDEVIMPALSDRRGKLILVSTPKGMNNLFYDYYQKAQADPKWFLYKSKASDSKIIDDDELAAARAVMGDEKYAQEFLCSFIGNIQGSIYGDIISTLDDKKQLGRVPHDPGYPVSTAWDIGFSDSTAIIFFQNVGHAINIIDFVEDRNQAFPYYAQILKEKDYVYDKHIGPHDLEQTSFASGKSLRDVAYQMKINFRIAPRVKIEDGIHQVKMLLARCYIDTDNCSKLITALRHYHRKFSDKERVFKLKPVHDFSSHACDAMRALATGFNEERVFNKNKQTAADNRYQII
jgi:phage terminase large subunit